MKLIFAVLYVINDGPYTLLQNGIFFSHLYLQFFYNILCYLDTCLRSRKFISVPNSDKISQSTAEIKLLSLTENGRPPYWNCISALDFDLVIDMSFCICLPSIVEIERSTAEL